MHSCVLYMNKYRLFREVIVDSGLILWGSFTGWSVLMHFHSQTSTKNISPPPPQTVPCTGQHTKPCSLKQVSCRKQTLSTSDTADIRFVQGKLLKLQVWFCRRNICAFVFPRGTMTFPGAGAVQPRSQPSPAQHWAAAATRWQSSGTDTTALLPRDAPGMLILCSRWLSRWFLASSLITIHINGQIKDSNKRLFN